MHAFAPRPQHWRIERVSAATTDRRRNRASRSLRENIGRQPCRIGNLQADRQVRGKSARTASASCRTSPPTPTPHRWWRCGSLGHDDGVEAYGHPLSTSTDLDDPAPISLIRLVEVARASRTTRVSPSDAGRPELARLRRGRSRRSSCRPTRCRYRTERTAASKPTSARGRPQTAGADRLVGHRRVTCHTRRPCHTRWQGGTRFARPPGPYNPAAERRQTKDGWEADAASARGRCGRRPCWP